MTSASTWERIERRKLRRQERQRRHHDNRPGDRSDPSRPAATDMLPQIKHILVLMMENHSFDNYLGTLGRGEGLPLGDDGTPDAENPDSAGTVIRAYHASSTAQEHGVPCQSWSASHTQWADGKMNGFVTSTEQAAPEGDKTSAMVYWTDQDLPFYHGLARTFPLADRWFSSCLGPTFPNRRFLLAGTANGLMDDLPFNLLDRPQGGTIMDMLTRHGISWVNYRPAGSDQSEFSAATCSTGAVGTGTIWAPSAVRCARPATCSSGICSSRRPFTRSGWPATSARADPAGRGGDLAARRTGPDGSGGVPDAAAAARTGAGVGHLVSHRIERGRMRR